MGGIEVVNSSSRTPAPNADLRAAWKQIAVGVLLCAIGLTFAFGWVGNPINELRLILWAERTIGTVFERVDGDFESAATVKYKYNASDGSAHTNGPSRISADLFASIDDRNHASVFVEYLPNEPSISRIAGDGCQTLFEWMWRKLLVGGVLVAICCVPGAEMTSHGIKSINAIANGLPVPKSGD